ncbi:MocR-like pyridoxine biosynthesis transcription factor PdxR [Rhizobium leguminosarum]|uniref:MocR-like pyridoxine biosynthesis transcription factor PdxR n=1 Tax=Rhizobium leguminosarum TaxID=384 RepID=UPI0013DB4F9E|nr:PLP-dependent aminotransferase family protein [Rhizobium leguminosarum]NEK38611.1 aminotransferase class I/II-fold pyridoxal phosphate-dependent enzyme [Rhizobium leguminosarum]
MARRQDVITIPSLRSFDRTTGRIGQQFTQALRDAIAKGDLKPGQRLPSTRALSVSLGIARGTIVEAFDQLYAEGYLATRARSGTIVANVHEGASEVTSQDVAVDIAAPDLPLPENVGRLAAVGRALRPQGSLPFAIAHPAGAVAPDDKWRRLGNRVRATRPATPSGYIDPRGLPELRSAIADYVRKARAVRCCAEQVIITAGTQQGLFLAATVLLTSGDSVWAEDPAYPGIEAVLGNFSVTVCRVPVDGQGLDVKEAILRCPGARVAFVTPSHQYPLGMPMSMPRRTSLLSWARNNNAWVVEDDYDSELRYAGHPFPSLQGLDPSRVVYLGTMSKMLFSSLRLGYAIVPEPLIDAFAGARAMIDRHSATPDQHVLASYMREGLFEAHVRRIRGVYAERRAALIEAIEQELPSWATLQPSDQGMHLVLWLPLGVDDVKIADEAGKVGLVVRPISPMFANPPARFGLILGFGGFTPAELRAAVRRLKDVLDASVGAIRGPLSKPEHLATEV